MQLDFSAAAVLATAGVKRRKGCTTQHIRSASGVGGYQDFRTMEVPHRERERGRRSQTPKFLRSHFCFPNV